MLDGPKRMTTCGANYGAEVDAKSLRERELTASGKQYLMPEGWEQKWLAAPRHLLRTVSTAMTALMLL